MHGRNARVQCTDATRGRNAEMQCIDAMHGHDAWMQCVDAMHGHNAWMHGASVLQTQTGVVREHHLWISQLLQNPSNYLTQSHLRALFFFFPLLYKYAR